MYFLVLRGHEIEDVEDVIEQGDAYAVVQKHEDTLDIVESTDPRGPQPG